MGRVMRCLGMKDGSVGAGDSGKKEGIGKGGCEGKVTWSVTHWVWGESDGGTLRCWDSLLTSQVRTRLSGEGQ